MPNKQMSTFVVEVDGEISKTYDVIDSRVASSDISSWNDKCTVYRGNVSINKLTNVATLSGFEAKYCYASNPRSSSYGKQRYYTYFLDVDSGDVYQKIGFEYFSEDPGRDLLTYSCISGNLIKSIQFSVIGSASYTSWTGTYSESTLVSSVDGKSGTVTVLPSGGTTGQILKKTSGTDYAVEWANETGAVTSVNGQTGAVTIAETLKVTITNTGSSATPQFTSDHTFSEIAQTIENGGTVYLAVYWGDDFEIYNLSDGEEYNDENTFYFTKYQPQFSYVDAAPKFMGLTLKQFVVSLDNEDTVWTYWYDDLYIPSDITYELSISNNVITLTDSGGGTSTATLPVYDGGVST